MKDKKFEIDLDDGNGNVRLIGEIISGDIHVTTATRNGKGVPLWNKRIGYAKCAIRLEAWEELIRKETNQ